jgi:nucleoside-diphosphate-sugar epimerase
MTIREHIRTSDTVSILGCGWLGKSLGIALRQSGYTVLGSTTTGEKMHELSAAGITPFLIRFTPNLAGEAGSFFKSRICVVGIPPALRRVDAAEFLSRMNAIRGELVNGGASKVVFISTTSVYKGRSGEVEEGDANEDSEFLKAESVFRKEKAFETTVIRFAGLVGPGRHPARFLSGKKVSGGADPVNLIHLNDCIGVIESVIKLDAWGNVFNACADLHPTRRDFYEFVCAQKDVQPPEFVPPDCDAPKLVSNTRLRHELGYQFSFPDPMKMTY